MFKNVIVRRPSKSVVEGQTTSDMGKPNYEKAYKQHEEYIEVLRSCNVELSCLSLRF